MTDEQRRYLGPEMGKLLFLINEFESSLAYPELSSSQGYRSRNSGWHPTTNNAKISHDDEQGWVYLPLIGIPPPKQD